ncbi:MAG: hypothetical protein ACR2J6_01275 [Thermoleophilaceae bacterium]
MNVDDLVLVHGMHDTRLALRRFNDRPGAFLWPWMGLSLIIAVVLLVAVWAVATLSPADPTPIPLNGVAFDPGLPDYAHILYRNLLVLALHAMACVAGFMAGSSLPLSAANRSGVDRWVHDRAGPLAIAFVTLATLFSLGTQAYAIGGTAATIAAQLQVSPGLLMLGLLPHAVPELVALFLPLAAWLIASRQKRWNELLAATVVCVGLAVPVLLASAAVELWASPELMKAIAGA